MFTSAAVEQDCVRLFGGSLHLPALCTQPVERKALQQMQLLVLPRPTRSLHREHRLHK